MTEFNVKELEKGKYSIEVVTDEYRCFRDLQTVARGYTELGHSPCDMCKQWACGGCKYQRTSVDEDGLRR